MTTRIGAFGELMLRLTPPEHYLLEQTHSLHMDFTGTGVNILGNMAHFGLPTQMLTVLPANRLGDAALHALQGLGVGVDHVLRAHEYLGSYFAELGFGQRPTQVTYQNRLSSAFCVASANELDIDGFLSSVDMLHICGISLSLTDSTAASALELARRARERGVRVCFDFNFRPSLNEQPGKIELMRKRYTEILASCDIVFGAHSDLRRLFDVAQAPDDEDGLVDRFFDTFGIAWFVGTEKNAEVQPFGVARSMRGVLYAREESGAIVRHASETRVIQVLDRIGAGDAYAAGILLGYAQNWDIERTLAFAVANAALANTIHGDVPLTTVDQVEQLMQHPATDLVR